MPQVVGSKIGSREIRCAFCDNWEGDARVKFLGNDRLEYDASVYGRCVAKNGVQQNSGQFCKRFVTAPNYLKYIR